jgi:pimeloyl-ACP methyl ester carboxylesterase
MNRRAQQSGAAEANKDTRGGAREVVREEKIEVEGLTTRYLTAGKGLPLMLLHGMGDAAADWQWVMPALAHTHLVYAPDLPGSGGSSKPSAEQRYSPAFFERFVGAFLDAVGVDRAAVVGNSLGGLAIARLPNGSLELIPDCGHLPQVEHHERFAAVISRFLGEQT